MPGLETALIARDYRIVSARSQPFVAYGTLWRSVLRKGGEGRD
jgi:hypothetical protein